MPKRLLLLALLATPTAPAWPQGNPLILSAYTDSRGLRFDSPIPLPWETWLPPELQQTALAADSGRRHELRARRSEFGITEVVFDLPTTGGIEQRFYYLLDPAGLHLFRPTGLTGTASIKWRESTDEVSAVGTGGQVQATEGASGPGGFVLVTEEPVTFAVTPSTLTADDLLAPHGGTYIGQGTPFREIIAQYQVRETAPGSGTWIWVQWKPDEGMVEAGCSRRFSLFRLGAEPVEVKTTDDGCDV
ncbi:MAG: hypothetical protein ACREMO_10790 [Gemmatimonadales bacterium]